MDRGYDSSPAQEGSDTNDVGLSIKEIGQGLPMGIAANNVHGVASKIRMGVGSMEIQFPGAVRSNRQSHTPGVYGKDQRVAMEELTRINEVKLTTHASFGIMGLAGVDQQGNFNKEHRKILTDEVKRAIDFAADAAHGGSVVVHTGEYERPISEEAWAEGGKKFRHYDEEAERATIRVVDRRNGRVIQDVKKNQKVTVAEWRKADKSYMAKYQEGDFDKLCGKQVMIKKGDYIDYEGNKIIDPLNVEHGRLPEYNVKTGRFNVKLRDWQYFVDESKEWNRLMEEKKGRPLTYDEKMTPEERYIRSTLETREGYARGWALQFSVGMKENIENIRELRKLRAHYQQLDQNLPEDEKWKIMMRDQKYGKAGQLLPPKTKNPLEVIDKAIWEEERNLAYHQQSGLSQEKEAHDSREQQENILSARKYALKEAKKAYADAAMHAYDLTQKRKHELDKPIFLTLENIFPERYGGHPQELKNLIMLSRQEMAKKLRQERGLNEKQARDAAAVHIKATIDTGHFNIWRKYFRGSDEEFKSWLVNQVEDLAKNKLIGNVHLTDNFGYQDDHLAPGQGTAPNKEIVKVLKKHGYDEAYTIEPGADATTDLSDFHGLMKTWRHFGNSVYGIGGGGGGPTRVGAPSRQWTDIQYSYFGQNRPPYFVFGGYVPSQDWTLWSQVPME